MPFRKIESREDLHLFLEMDAKAMEKEKKPKLFGDEEWKFLRILRKHEYYLNATNNKILQAYYRFRHHQLGIKLGWLIPCNTFGPGLRINHTGLLIVNPKAKIGAYCDIHQGVNIGEGVDGCAPSLGDHVWIGPGAKLYGNIEVGDNCMIGANAVVTKSFPSGNVVLAGVPAKIVGHSGNAYF